MIAFDTNVLVRLLVKDDPEQFATALSLLERAVEAEEVCYLSDGVLCETVWVLDSQYGASRADILAAMSEVLADPRYGFDDEEGVRQALRAFEEGRADFSDHLIGERARRKGARTTYSFDKKLKNQQGFTFQP